MTKSSLSALCSCQLFSRSSTHREKRQSPAPAPSAPANCSAGAAHIAEMTKPTFLLSAKHSAGRGPPALCQKSVSLPLPAALKGQGAWCAWLLPTSQGPSSLRRAQAKSKNPPSLEKGPARGRRRTTNSQAASPPPREGGMIPPGLAAHLSLPVSFPRRGGEKGACAVEVKPKR